MSSVWITWERQRRNIELSRALGCEYVEINHDGKNRLQRYWLSTGATLSLLRERTPRVVFGQSPSLLLALLLVLMRRSLGYKLIIDAHNAGVFPCEGRWLPLNYMVAKMLACADLVLVTNAAMKTYVEGHGGRSFVLQDRIPDIGAGQIRRLEGAVNFLFICKFHSDEPYRAVFEAARLLSDDVCIYVTGNFRKIDQALIEGLPDNLKLVGFVPEEEYLSLLHSVDAVIDLTERDNCLLCGAYEALGAGKPIILSKKKALQDYFSKGTVFVENTPEQIKSGIDVYLKNRKAYARDIRRCRKIVHQNWERRFADLVAVLEGIRGSRC